MPSDLLDRRGVYARPDVSSTAEFVSPATGSNDAAAPERGPVRRRERRQPSRLGRHGLRRITTRGVPEAALDVDGANTEKPARSNIAAVPMLTDADEIRVPPVWTG